MQWDGGQFPAAQLATHQASIPALLYGGTLTHCLDGPSVGGRGGPAVGGPPVVGGGGGAMVVGPGGGGGSVGGKVGGGAPPLR